MVGLGASGRAAARLALHRGAKVHATDLEIDAETSAARDELGRLGARVELGPHRMDALSGADTVVVSPGIPPDAPVLRDLREAGIRWISELEFAFRFLQGALIAVTGTNGKTTTAALAAHLLRERGLRVGLGGNIGADFGPAASELASMDPPPDVFVVEVSSFQLADVDTFRPDVGVVTNLAPDHLDRYPDERAYYADKARLFDNATSTSRWILNGDDPAVLDLAGSTPGRRHLFSVEGREEAEARLLQGELLLGGRRVLSADELPLLGRHNVANALAAALTALVGAQVASEDDEFDEWNGSDEWSGSGGWIARGLRSFPPLPHRLEGLGEKGGVLWVNDSKATNVGATLSAVASLDRPVILLLGGKDKGEDYARLHAVAGHGVRGVVVYGAARERIRRALEGAEMKPDALRSVDGPFEEAVRLGASLASAGDVLLLSPACSSYDMFPDYRARGDRFRDLFEDAG